MIEKVAQRAAKALWQTLREGENAFASPGCAGVKRSPPIALWAEGAGF